MFTVSVSIEGLERKFRTMALYAEDLDPAMRRFGGYLKKKAKERYQAQDFPPLAMSTIEKRAQKGLRGLERKLHRDLRKATARSNPGSPRGLLARVMGVSKIELKTIESRGVKSRMAVLAEFQRRHRPSGSLAQRADLKPLSAKQISSLGARTGRAVAKAIGAPILGTLPKTLIVETGSGWMKLVSRTKQQWSEIHNEGGSAGKGAKEPKRETIRLDNKDLGVFQEILKEYLLLPFTSGG